MIEYVNLFAKKRNLLTRFNRYATIFSSSFDNLPPNLNKCLRNPKRPKAAVPVTIAERRQRLLALVHEEPGITVPALAQRLDVSQGTIRNDLNALAKAGQLTRVRGGAESAHEPIVQGALFAAAARVNVASKSRIARWAANLVEDGDSILLDASTTVYHLARFLQDRRNLTVVTNGLDVARAFAQNLSNTVILLGGMLNAGGTSVTGLVSEHFLADLHIKTAFVSCTGFTPEAGLTESDIRGADLKRLMIDSASQVVALIDSSKFGRVDLAPFAQLQHVCHIFTDADLAPSWIHRLEACHVPLSICGETRVTNIAPSNGQAAHFKIGFANLGEQLPFCGDVRRSVERAAQAAGNIDLILADNRLDGQVALDVAANLIAERVDLAIEYQLDYGAGDLIMAKFQDAGILVIAVDIPMVGATFFGVDNYRSGHMAGVALGKWIQGRWGGQLDRLVTVERRRAGPLPAARIRGQIDGVESILGEIPSAKLIELDTSETSDGGAGQVAALLNEMPTARHLAFVTFSDTLALAVVAAGRRLHRQADMAVVSQGADRDVREEMQSLDSPLIGATTFEPDKYGEQIIPLALKILRGEPVPPAVYINHTFVSGCSELADDVAATNAIRTPA
jgi:ribose transport system substrate-binding protein